MTAGDNLTGAFQRQTGFSGDRLKDIGVALIERSRAAAQSSDHHTYHVGSALLSLKHIGKNGHGRLVETMRDNANKIPDAMKDAGYTSHHKFGDGHPTVHGEFPLLFGTPPAEHLFLGCNTPFCGSCMKSAIIRGVDALFLDLHSLPSPNGGNGNGNRWTDDFSDYWANLCIPMATNAQIPIYAVDTENGDMITLVEGEAPERRPAAEYPARILSEHEIQTLENNPDLFLFSGRNKRSAIGVARHNATGKNHFIFAEDTLPPGYSYRTDQDKVEEFADGHYRFPIDPISQMCMVAARHNLALQDGRIVTNYVPSSGRQLDLAYVGIRHLYVTNQHVPASEDAMKAQRELQRLGMIEYLQVKPNKEMLRVLRDSQQDPSAHCSVVQLG